MSISEHNKKVKSPIEKWKEHKTESIYMSERMMKHPSLRARAARMKYCGDVVGAEKCPVCGKIHLKGGHMCHDRLCPLCQWRLSATRFAQMLRCLDVLDAKLTRENATIGMLTLTLRNVPVFKLRDTIDKMSAAWKIMRQRKMFGALVIGAARSVEITYNAESNSYHPHLHIFLITRPFTDEMRSDLSDFIVRQRNKVREHRIKELKTKGLPIPENLNIPITAPKFEDDKFLLTEYARCSWQKALGIWYRPQVQYKYAYNKGGRDAAVSSYECISWSENKRQAALSAARECAKYVVGIKALAAIPDDDLYKFATEINGAQMVSYSGILREARKALNFKTEKISEEDSNKKCSSCGAEVINYLLVWSGGYYKEVDL